MSRHEPFSVARTEELVAQHLHLEGPLLPILHAVQEVFGFVPEAAVPVVASGLNVSRADVHGVVTFYEDFHQKPDGEHVVKICRAEACQSMGGEELAAHAERCLGVSFGQTSADGQVTLEKVFCLGLCATAPAAMVNGDLRGRLSRAGVEAIAREVGR
ncbi:formate dehydrogenase subunit gamma [Oryzibacter oryziterrae]|uniref:formate dehydrogenase subunit gamma n=1 Tax=Oryzibacter oryziterrae TaxID=2766474 RepID=UPI001F024AE6|nr:formate dehydrogenase subunit gamma [Oryzibacter oryziterrae]